MAKDEKSELDLAFEEQEAEVVHAVKEMKDEAAEFKRDRLRKNQFNWDVYHGRGRKGHKRKGQSREYLHKSALAAEQITALFKQSLVNFDKWIDVEWLGEVEDDIFTPGTAKKLLQLYFEYADVKSVFSDAIKVAVHESLATVKIGGQMTNVPRYISHKKKGKIVDKKEWRLAIDVISAEDYFPDPFGDLYEIHQMVLDRNEALDLSSEDPEDPEKLYLREKVEMLQSMEGELQSENRKSRNQGNAMYRKRAGRRFPVMIDEFHGTLIGRDGKVMEWTRKDGSSFELKNVKISVGNERVLLAEPEPNPRWSNTRPFVSAPLLRVPFARWPKAIMDAAANLNLTLNELFNLMLDGGLSAVHGIKQLREGWLTPETLDEISDHIPPGTTLGVNDLAPMNAKVLERVDSGEVPGDAFSMFNIVEQLFAENALSNEVRLGSLPQKQVRATEVSLSEQSLSGVFDGLSGDFEDVFVEKLASECWMEILQNVDRFPKKELESLLGKDKADVINKMSPSERFERAGQGFRWRGKGIRTITQRMRDFQKLVQFLSVVGQNELLLQEFNMRFSMPKMIGKFLGSLEIDAEELQLTPGEMASAKMRRQLEEQAAARATAEGDNAERGPGRQPEIPQESGAQADPGIASGNEGGEG